MYGLEIIERMNDAHVARVRAEKQAEKFRLRDSILRANDALRTELRLSRERIYDLQQALNESIQDASEWKALYRGFNSCPGGCEVE